MSFVGEFRTVPARSPILTDVRHIGPDRDRNISGTCSACGVTLLAWLKQSEESEPVLERRLETLFRQHVDAHHHPRMPRATEGKQSSHEVIS